MHPLDLPRNYLYQMIAMEFKTPVIIKPVPINEDVNLEPEDRARLFQAHSSFLKFMQFVDKIPIDEQQRRNQKNMIKDKVGRIFFFFFFFFFFLFFFFFFFFFFFMLNFDPILIRVSCTTDLTNLVLGFFMIFICEECLINRFSLTDTCENEISRLRVVLKSLCIK